VVSTHLIPRSVEHLWPPAAIIAVYIDNWGPPAIRVGFGLWFRRSRREEPLNLGFPYPYVFIGKIRAPDGIFSNEPAKRALRHSEAAGGAFDGHDLVIWRARHLAHPFPLD